MNTQKASRRKTKLTYFTKKKAPCNEFQKEKTTHDKFQQCTTKKNIQQVS